MIGFAMAHHGAALRKLFQEAFAPTPFSFAVRRSTLHSPEGAISVEESLPTIQSPVLWQLQWLDDMKIIEII